MAYPGSTTGSYTDFSGLRAEGREPGARRKKLAGYLKAANELRQSYFSEGGPGTRDSHVGDDDSVWADAAVVRKGNEEMILFPSYARRHIKSKPKVEPGSIQQVPGTGRDYRDTVGAGDAEFWKSEWEKYENDNAIVDVDVRGWIYSPHKGATTRKQRLMIGLARQLSGIPAPKSGENSKNNSRPSSPTGRQDEEFVQHEADSILRRGQAEAEIAGRGGFSETPRKGSDSTSLYTFGEEQNRGRPRSGENRFSNYSRNSSQGSSGNITPQQGITPRPSWSSQQPSKMSAAELVLANNNLLARLKPFMANPLASTAISAFFYNDSVSRQKTVYTDASGHFNLRAALDFVPTHVRILAGENLSATEEVHITEPHGVSLISDIDDTVKHSAITMGPREIFRNAFTRDLSELTVKGVKEWYHKMHDMGVKIHYVSNSPWQMYPIITSFFSLAGLPKGSFHLKQYSGMLQGIFEPVAERKKSNLDRIMRDFPDRKFILVGDSGEADLEVYTDVALENPKKILGIFIRDVTSIVKTGYFDQSNGAGAGGKHGRHHSRNQSGDSLAMSKRLSRPDDIRNDDPDLEAAIAASLRDMEQETRLARQFINPDRGPEFSRFSGSDGLKSRSRLSAQTSDSALSAKARQAVTTPEHERIDLIDFSEDLPPLKPWVSQEDAIKPKRYYSQHDAGLDKEVQPSPPPRPPSKPHRLRSPSPSTTQLARVISNESTGTAASPPKKTPPARPRKPSSAVKPAFLDAHPELQQLHQQPARPLVATKPSPLSKQVESQEDNLKTPPPPLPTRTRGYKEKFQSRFGGGDPPLPPPRPPFAMDSFASGTGGPGPQPRAHSTLSPSRSFENIRRKPVKSEVPPPPPPRRQGTATSTASARSAVGPAATADYSTKTRRSGLWDTQSVDDPDNKGGPDLQGVNSTARPNHHPTNSTFSAAHGNRPSSLASSPGGGSLPNSPGGDALSRKEAMWQQRVNRAKAILEPRGVTFRTWRTGDDIRDIAVKLVELAAQERKKDEDKARWKLEKERGGG
ncbi:hypothetical protein K431DRAFT_310409 [Polychaeton citri CBS 116435]|uniref:Phosphatidate phosphatase APP1 catalytic domain-containing protein n=1 Tax=Polychaeton citri CBS 116435 TaxID=1314669 RepID=A0A9P4QFU2_9PEZI|nr:hypothetical protein K431DRAFT_310409 [Polychaeton citri CBS 116435]